MTASLGVGVIGVGAMGRRHAENLSAPGSGATLVAVADADPGAAQTVAGALGVTATTVDGLLADPRIDGVVIATPPETHADMIMAAAREGKDVLCEKPVAASVAEARRAQEEAIRHGIGVQTGFMRRYDPFYLETWERIRRGEIGRPVLFTGISRDREPPSRSYFTSPAAGNLFVESAGHDFDLVRWLMDDEITHVQAAGAIIANTGLADVQPMDTGFATLRLSRGGAASVQVYKSAGYGYDIRSEIVGTDGAVTVGEGPSGGATRIRPGQSGPGRYGHWLERFADAYRAEIVDWVRRTKADAPYRVTLDDGIRALAVSEAAERSRREERPVPVEG